MNDVLITGASGRLGRELTNFFDQALTPSRVELDVSNERETDGYIRSKKPKTVVHLAALADVRRCEGDKELAWRTNVEGTRNLVGSVSRHVKDPYFIMMSTPCVFSGVEGNYLEDALPNPKNYYGLTKLVAENIVASGAIRDALVIRGNFVTRERWPYPKAFDDRFGTFLFSDQIAAAIHEVIENRLTGKVHLVGDRKISMYELARMVSPSVGRMTVRDYDGPALTMDLSLDSKAWKKYTLG